MMKSSQEVKKSEAQDQKGKHTGKNKPAKNAGEVRGNKNPKIRRKRPKQHAHKKKPGEVRRKHEHSMHLGEKKTNKDI